MHWIDPGTSLSLCGTASPRGASLPLLARAETRRSAERVTVNLQPRYPLFGGWSTKFLFGWSLPLGKAVSKVRPGGGGWQGRRTGVGRGSPGAGGGRKAWAWLAGAAAGCDDVAPVPCWPAGQQDGTHGAGHPDRPFHSRPSGG